MDDTDEDQPNMVSNLPLLFANGYPTSLEKITEAQLENFIPFMVQCSLGQINVQDIGDFNEPEWWPEGIPFTIPLVKPKEFKGSWSRKLKDAVQICYQFHNSSYLLKFCSELATLEQAALRFINNYNSTTSLYERRNNKLLVTFRNENMSYDQPQRNRKSLLLKKFRHETDDTPQQIMVEQAVFDIYLCDYCDGEFYSSEAIKEHERTCTSDDDVIICDPPSPEVAAQPLSNNIDEKTHNEQRESFLFNFQLQKPGSNSFQQSKELKDEKTKKLYREVKNDVLECVDNTPFEKLRRLPRRNRGVFALSRCPTIPLSSPAGQLLIKASKTVMTPEYLNERLDRMERFCHASILAPGVNRPKFLDKKFNPPNVVCTFKKPADYTLRTYIYPRRQLHSKHRNKHFLFINTLLLKKCQPLTIRLKRYTEQQLKDKFEKSKYNNKNKMQEVLSSIEVDNRFKNQQQIIIDTIDLCSSDEDESPKRVKIMLPASSRSLIRSSISSSASSSSSNFNGGRCWEEEGGISTKTITKPSINREENRNVSKFEGNFLVSQSPKPLQPSVFLFSNYSTDTPSHHHFNHHYANSTSNLVQQTNNKLPQYSSSYQNQENLEMNNIQQQQKASSTEDHLLSSVVTSSNNINNNNNNNNNNNSNSNSSSSNRTDRNSSSTTSSRVLHYMSSYRDSDVSINKISSPNRIISIDLTL